jgi:hypothetical protein
MRIVSKPPSDREPRRVQPLPALPVFFSLQGKMGFVCGRTDAVAWKRNCSWPQEQSSILSRGRMRSATRCTS